MEETRPPKQIGRYRIEKRLGAGGMAEAFLAYADDTPVVLKRLLPERARNRDAIDQFFQEARLAMQLRHPNIIGVDELGQFQGDYFLAMRYVAGLTLRMAARHTWAAKRTVPPAIALRCIVDAAHGLHYAHTLTDENGNPAGVVHRDVSPDNMLVSIDGVTHVFDFGIAKQKDRPGLTRPGEVKGKVGFMSPEQLDGRIPLDARTDLFALGVTLHWVLSKKRPFQGATQAEVIKNVIEGKATPLRTIDPTIPVEVEQLTLRLLRKSRDDRPKDALEMIRIIEAATPLASQAEVSQFIRALFEVELTDASTTFKQAGEGSGEPADGMHVALPALPELSKTMRLRGEEVPTTPMRAVASAPEPPPKQRSKTPMIVGVGLAFAVAAVVLFALMRP